MHFVSVQINGFQANLKAIVSGANDVDITDIDLCLGNGFISYLIGATVRVSYEISLFVNTRDVNIPRHPVLRVKNFRLSYF